MARDYKRLTRRARHLIRRLRRTKHAAVQRVTVHELGNEIHRRRFGRPSRAAAPSLGSAGHWRPLTHRAKRLLAQLRKTKVWSLQRRLVKEIAEELEKGRRLTARIAKAKVTRGARTAAAATGRAVGRAARATGRGVRATGRGARTAGRKASPHLARAGRAGKTRAARARAAVRSRPARTPAAPRPARPAPAPAPRGRLAPNTPRTAPAARPAPARTR